jgi:hypothetical protein
MKKISCSIAFLAISFQMGFAQTVITEKDGKVGIGTTAPSQKLEVMGNILSQTGNGLEGALILGNPSHGLKRTGNNVTMHTAGEGALTFSTSAWTGVQKETARFTMDGNMGIGTTEPKSKLDVVGDIMGYDLISGGSNAWIFHTPDDGRKALIVSPKTPDGSDWDWAKSTQFKEDGTVVVRKLEAISGIDIAAGSPLKLAGADLYHGLKHKRFYPGDKQLLDGPYLYGWAGGSLGYSNYSGETHVLNWNNQGNVGIGTTNPGTKLQVGDFTQQNTLKITGSVDINKAPILSLYRLGSSESMIAQYGSNMIFANTTGLSDYSDEGLKKSANMTITLDGKVGIGTTSPDEKLTVNGNIHAKEVRIDLTVPADYVFEKYYNGNSNLKADYQMPSLAQVADYTQKYKHLPQMPSAKEIQAKGWEVGQMSNLLLQKIEELTLYMIEQQKEIAQQQKEILAQKARLDSLENNAKK